MYNKKKEEWSVWHMMIILPNKPNDKVFFIQFTYTTYPFVTKQNSGVNSHAEQGQERKFSIA